MSIEVRTMTPEDFKELNRQWLRAELFARSAATLTELRTAFPNMNDLEDALTDLMAEEEVEQVGQYKAGLHYALTLWGIKNMLEQGRQYDLNLIDFRIARFLGIANFPITALLAAAYERADTTNKALIKGCWPTVAAQFEERMSSWTAGTIESDKFVGPVQDYVAGCRHVAENYALRLYSALQESVDKIKKRKEEGK